MHLDMGDLRSHIRKALFYNSQGGGLPVPREIILANCLIAGFDEEAINAEHAAMVNEGDLIEEEDAFIRVDD